MLLKFSFTSILIPTASETEEKWEFLLKCFYLISSLQQAFNATAVVRHMRRLQLGSSMGSSIDASNPPTRQNQTQKLPQSQSQMVQNQPALSQNAGQPAQSQSTNAASSKTSSTDNNIAAPRKECEYESVVPIGGTRKAREHTVWSKSPNH